MGHPRDRPVVARLALGRGLADGDALEVRHDLALHRVEDRALLLRVRVGVRVRVRVGDRARVRASVRLRVRVRVRVRIRIKAR